jgi:hypothetical protein
MNRRQSQLRAANGRAIFVSLNSNSERPMPKNMHVVITPELHSKLRKTAQEEGRHMRHIVEKALREDLRRRELIKPRKGRD